jgi:hypothetical protein
MGHEAFQQRYPSLFAGLKVGAEITEEEVRSFYGARQVVVEDDQDERFASFTNQDKMHYKIMAADRLAQDADADLVLRIRPDFLVGARAFTWGRVSSLLSSSRTILTDKPMGFSFGHSSVGDQLAIAVPKVIRVYADTYEEVPALGASGMLGIREDLKGHQSIAASLWAAQIEVIEAPIRKLGLAEAVPLSSAAILDALKQDDRGEERDQQLQEAVRRDLD